MPTVEVVNVFTSASGGGNPAPIVIDAGGLDEAAMTAIAKSYGHESGFVFSPDSGTDADFRFRFFVPRHEMSMCGHATIGAVWLLHRHGRIGAGPVAVQTLSGKVTAQLRAEADGTQFIEISQPAGTVQEIPRPELREDIIRAIGLEPADILDLPFLNACTSRIKTLIPVRSPARLDAARPDSARIEQLCEQIDSTGLYLFSPDSSVPRKFDARQFPKSSGYPEDAATGIAAAALAFGLLHYGLVKLNGQPVLVHQGRAMGCPSDIHVRFDLAPGAAAPVGCFVGGRVVLAEGQHAQRHS
ncbi:PhzF family phenazine biosynthesis protein [Undibacterium sp. TJN25]|uniref:PhzF family phenazine biosynthesis protein n=1 Tax=Undibacterium sp. TJN25 TaxID=3413056 RepID=UPI003BF2558A